MLEQNTLIIKASALIVDMIAEIIVTRTRSQALDSGLRSELAIAKAMGTSTAMSSGDKVMADVREIKDLHKSLNANIVALHDVVESLIKMGSEYNDLSAAALAVIEDAIATKKEFVQTLETVECHLNAQAT
jgi:hypothetical protein